MKMKNKKLLHFVQEMSTLLQTSPAEDHILSEGKMLLKALVAHDDWLPAEFTVPHPLHYQQYLLYADPLEKFSIVSFVWGPGQKTPVHDHLTWGLIGILRGQERDTQYFKQTDGSLKPGPVVDLLPGQVVHVSPSTHDVHEVANYYADRVSIGIHVYGGNIGRINRHVFNPATGEPKSFVSGYCNDTVPNLWN
jgi:predicted metal-dependent enzyme (double-stranded beta helix superfamily)